MLCSLTAMHAVGVLDFTAFLLYKKTDTNQREWRWLRGFGRGSAQPQNPTPTQAMDKAAGSQFLAESHAKSTAFSQLSMIKSSDTP
ncbi:hypothetical protein QC762_0058210 [Podospora pseudocomata]|uniref:Uncharacterized protein n=1 Tax=Podospora pseudocomata TaxID=2093779 RepID=A0ABR0GKU8_9PEZI|nr:hypothetical protein QC762_0058210 [Podospora pseudocomata]